MPKITTIRVKIHIIKNSLGSVSPFIERENPVVQEKLAFISLVSGSGSGGGVAALGSSCVTTVIFFKSCLLSPICWQWLKMTVSCHNGTMGLNVTNIVWTGNVNHEFMICDSIDIMIGPNNCLHLTECELELWFRSHPPSTLGLLQTNILNRK